MTSTSVRDRTEAGELAPRGRILVVDDEHSIRYTFSLFLDEAGHEAIAVAEPEDAMRLVAAGGVDLAFVDILLENTSGIDLMERIKRRSPSTEVVIVTGAPSVETAAAALRLGAFDYLLKPVGQEALLRSAAVALRHKAVRDEAERYRTNLEAIFRSIEDGIVSVDERLNVVEVNRAAERLCGLRREDVLGRRWSSALLECGGGCTEALGRSIVRRPPVVIRHLECRARHRPDQVVDVKATPLLPGGNGPSGGVMVIRDQTRLEDLERSLRRSRAGDLVGDSPAIRRIRATVESLAELPPAVLVTGERGAGKEVVAEALHATRRRRHLFRVDCSSLPGELLERELFGTGEGALTGSRRERREGWLELARGGTLFLDEIAEMPLALQARLSRVLETRVIERPGERLRTPVDVRVIAATSRDLGEEVARGRFREDLRSRLGAFEIHVPPLRERLEDVPALVHHLLQKLGARLEKGVTAVSDPVLELFSRYPWPGNVRELERVLERALVVAEGETLDVKDLPEELRREAASGAAVTA